MSTTVTGAAAKAPVLSLRARMVSGPLLGTPTATGVHRLVALAAVPMVAVTMTLALTSDHLVRPVAAALYWGYLVAASMAVGLYWWKRRPASRFGRLLVLFGVGVWVVTWQGSGWPLLFDIGVLMEAPFWLLTLYLFLAFPMGRVEPAAARWLMVALGGVALAAFYTWAFFSPVIAGAGPLTRCAPNCPENVLQIGSDATVADVAGKVETYSALVLTAAVFVLYLVRLVRASATQRRALMAVAVTSLLFLPAFFVTNFAGWILKVDVGTIETLAWGIVATRILLPLGFLIALLQAEGFATRALRILLERLTSRPTPERWREAVAEALDDRELQLAYREPATGRFVDASGAVLEPDARPAHRAWLSIDRDDQPVAAMVVDETLTENPELLGAAASATLLAVENGALEGELRASRARIVEAGDAERRRIERDLHDGAQQRLVALRMHLALVGEQLERSQEQQMLESLGVEIDEAIHELRDIARGVYPQLLSQAGVPAAIAAVGRRSGLKVRVVEHGFGRYPDAVETTVYFCCVECIQNAAKHAGPGASVTVDLGAEDGAVSFAVADDGVGFALPAVQRGSGLTNLGDRMAAAGGTLAIDTEPGRGTRVTGRLPAGLHADPTGENACAPPGGGGS